MLGALHSKLTYANVVATLALFVALSGGAYAAATLPRNSVGAKQLRKNSVTRPKIKNRAVTAAKIAAGAVTGYHVVESTLGAVPEATHAASATTAGNAAISRLDYESSTVNVPSGSSTPVTASASCPAGLYATGGGARVGDDNYAYLNDAGPSSRTTWEGSAWPYSGPGSTLTVYVICAPAAAVTP
jgi:hypothetical protein